MPTPTKPDHETKVLVTKRLLLSAGYWLFVCLMFAMLVEHAIVMRDSIAAGAAIFFLVLGIKTWGRV